MTRIIFKMAKNRIPQISLLWVTILLTASSRSENILRIRNLKCFNDFLKNMFCTWEVVNSTTSCHNDFALSYETFDGTNGMCPDLRNEQFGDSVMPNKCICNISVEHFIAGEEYKIKVESKGTSVGNITVPIKSTIKPKAPTNVQIEFLEQDNCLVKWDTGYKSTYITDKLSFQAQIIYKHNREVAREFIQTTPNYLFNKILLNRGESYVVRVRTRHLESRGGWSEWSSEEEWKNDFSHTIPEIMGVIIPVTCIVMLCLLVGCYICFTRYKKTWWDTIPSPAKSTFVKKKLIQKHRTFPDRNTTSRKSCGSFFSKIVKAHKFKCDQLTQQDTARQYVLGIVKSDCKKCIFEPKNEDVERCIEMYPKMEDESNPVQEDKATHETEDQPLEDLSIADMFFAILRDSSGIKVDTFDNFNAGLFGCPSLMGSFDKEEKDWLNLNDSGHSTLGYRNNSSDDFPLDSSSSIDMINMPCFDHWIDNEIDCMHYTPKGSIKKNYTYQCKGDCLTSSCYNSFANALSDAKKDFITDTTKTFCLDNFSQSAVLTKANIYQLHLCPKGSLYYNTKHQPNIKSKSGQIILQCQEGKTDPISKYQVLRHQSFDQRQTDLGCHMSGYKSFDQAVKQGDETSVSGYQSFDQAVQQGDETSVGGYQSFNQAVQQGDKECVPQVNGYQSFDQAIQESETEFGCSISGYKCFDRAVEEGIATSVCEVNGYRSFDQAVQESEPKFVCTVSAYKAFDQAVEERVATSVSEVNGYQSFDQAIKESEPEFGCNISGYKSFDQAVEEGVATSVSEVNGYQSFDQAIKESEPEFGCNISGYKSFGQAVEEGVAASMCKVNGYQSFDQAVKENEPEFGCSTCGYKSFGHAVEEGVATSLREVNGYKSFNQAIQESDTSGSSTCISVDSGYKSFDNLVCQNNDYSNRNGCKCKNNQYKNKTDFNSGEYKLISSGSMELKYSDCVKATMEKYPSFSDQPFKALRIAVGSNHTNDMALKHEETPLRLTFDIGEHLRNLENKHWHKLPLDNLETATIPFNHQIFPCHLDKVLFNQNQLINNKNRILHKCPLTIYNSEDMSMFKPLCDLDVMDSSEMNKHLLIQQSSLDKDGNSYMKIK